MLAEALNNENNEVNLTESDEKMLFEKINKLMTHQQFMNMLEISNYTIVVDLKLKYFIDHKQLQDKLENMYPEYKFVALGGSVVLKLIDRGIKLA